MLHQFLGENVPELVERCRVKAALRRGPGAIPSGLQHGIPIFLAQLAEMLDASGGGEAAIAASARKHGGEMRAHDFTIDEVVHDYGDLCQSITEMAFEKGVGISAREFGILNIRLDNAIAEAVGEFARDRALPGNLAAHQRVSQLAHEVRDLLNTSILAVSAIRAGTTLGLGGATAAALDRSLTQARKAVDEIIAETGDEQHARGTDA
jgi:hypothetical protein